MKPTQEQLNDPAWWEQAKDGFDYCYYIKDESDYAFTEGIFESAGFELLAKRPTKQAFVPNTDTKTLYWVAEVDSHGTPWNFDGPHDDYKSAEDSIPLLIAVGEKNRKLVVTSMEFRPIKSERDLFFYSVKKKLPKADTDDLIFAGKLYDAGCRFVETDK